MPPLFDRQYLILDMEEEERGVSNPYSLDQLKSKISGCLLGGSKYHLLVWDDPSGEMYWEDADALNFEGNTEQELFACDTRKVILNIYIWENWEDLFK